MQHKAVFRGSISKFFHAAAAAAAGGAISVAYVEVAERPMKISYGKKKHGKEETLSPRAPRSFTRAESDEEVA